MHITVTKKNCIVKLLKKPRTPRTLRVLAEVLAWPAGQVMYRQISVMVRTHFATC